MLIDYVLDFLPTYVLSEAGGLSGMGHRVRIDLSDRNAFWEGITGGGLPEGVERGPTVGYGWLEAGTPFLLPAASARFLPLVTSSPGRFFQLARRALSMGCFRYFLCGSELAMRLGTDPPDRIHCHFAWDAAHVGMWAAGLLGIPFSVTVHAADIFTPASDERVRILLDAARPPMTISRFNIDYMTGRWGREPAGRLALCRTGVDLRTLPRAVAADGAPTIFSTASGLAEKKGVRILLEACSLMASRGRRFRCVIAGSDREGRLLEQFRVLAEREGLRGLVEFPGSVPASELPAMVSASRLFVLPCLKAENGDMDGIPVSMMEAMGMGLPVVSTRISGIPELVEDGISGILVEPGDPGALADAIESILSDPGRAAEMGDAAARRIGESFSVECAVGSLLRAWAAPGAPERFPDAEDA